MTNENTNSPSDAMTVEDSGNESNPLSITFTDSQGEPAPYSEEQLKFIEATENEPTEELIFGKYKSMEEAEKAHKSLETGFHEKNKDDDSLPSDAITDEAEEAVDVESEEQDDKTELSEPTEASEIVDNAFISLVDAGEMTDEVQENFKKAGISPELVQAVEELVEFKKSHEQASVMDSVGGKDSYNEMVTWAAHNFNEGEIAQFDKSVTMGSQEELQSAVANLHARYQQATPTQTTSHMVKADAISNSNPGYESQAQMLADMQDPRYTKDEAYRKKVYAKANKSNF